MHWLPETVQDVVRCIDDIADATHADTFEPLHKPRWTRGNLHAANHNRDIKRAADQIIDTHTDAVVRGFVFVMLGMRRSGKVAEILRRCR